MADRNNTLKVFISYSRDNNVFAGQLRAALTACGFDVSIDTEAPGGVEWWANLRRLIRECDTVVFVLSPSSAKSAPCANEVKEALALKKRILTVTCVRLEPGPPPLDGPLPLLYNIQSIFFYEDPKILNSGFGDGLSRLVEALNLDFDWILLHTRYLAEAIEWQSKGKPSHLLLQGPKIAEAKAWAERKPNKAPDPTPLHLEFIAASEATEHDRLTTKQKELEEKEESQKERLVALRQARWALVGLLALALATFGGAMWQAYDTSRREAQVFESKAQDAFNSGAYDLAIRLGLAGLPPPGSLPLSYRSPALEDMVRLSHSSDRTLAILGSHRGPVSSFVSAPNGKHVLTRSAAGRVVKVWQGETGQLISEFEGSFSSIEFDKSGDLLVSNLNGGGKLEIWNAKTGKAIKELPRAGSTWMSKDAQYVLGGITGSNAPNLWRLEPDSVVEIKLQPASDQVNWATVTPDGARIVGEMGRALVVWSIETGQLIKELHGHKGNVRDEAISADGRLAASWAANDDEVRLWDLTTGELVKTLPGQAGIRRARFSDRGSRLVTSDGANIWLWDVAKGEQVGKLELTAGPVSAPESALKFDGDGTRLVTAGTKNDTLQLWDASNGKLVRTLLADQGSYETAVFSKDGSRLLTSTKGAAAPRLWNALTGEAVSEFKGHAGTAHASFDPSGTRLVTWADGDPVAILWDAGTGRLLNRLQGHVGPVRKIVFDEQSRSIATTGGPSDRTIRIWNVQSGTLAASLDGHAGAVIDAKFSADGLRLFSIAANDEAARIWDLKDREVAQSMPLPTLLGPRATVISEGDTFAVYDSSDAPVTDVAGTALVIRAGDGVASSVVKEQGVSIKLARLFAGGKRLLASGDYPVRQLMLFDVEGGEPPRVLKHKTGTMSTSLVETSADGQQLATRAYGDPAVHLWNGLTGEHVRELTGQAKDVQIVKMSKSGNRLVTVGTGEKYARLWDARTGDPAGNVRLDGHTGAVELVSISDSGDRIATASENSEVIKLWNGETGALIGDLYGHTGTAILNMEFSKDGKLLISRAKDDPVAWIWETGKGLASFQLTGHPGPITSAGFSEDGQHAFTRSDEGRDMRMWSLATGKQTAKLEHDGGGSVAALASPPPATWRVSRADGNKVAVLWDNQTGRPVARLAGHIGAVKGYKFSKDGNRLVTWAATDRTALLWDTTRNGAKLKELGPHGGPVEQVLITPDDALIVTRAYGDPVARVWDASTGNPVAELGFRNTAPILLIAFVKKETRLLAIAGDVVRMWDLSHLGRQRSKEPFDLACAGKQKVTRRQFSPLEMADPILRNFGVLQQPCDRSGPMRYSYWQHLIAQGATGHP